MTFKKKGDQVEGSVRSAKYTYTHTHTRTHATMNEKDQ